MPALRLDLSNLRSALLLFVTSASLWLALVASASAEVMQSFDSNIVVNNDSSLSITETIVYDYGGEQRHGIYRKISDRHPLPASAEDLRRYIGYDLVSVTRDGIVEPYTVDSSYPGLSVRIGDANKTITGVHTYQITYRANGALAKYPEGIELYWNVTGNEWPVPILDATVELSPGIQVVFDESQACYQGRSGNDRSCASKGYESDTTGRIFRASFLGQGMAVGEELTIAQRLSLPVEPVVLESARPKPEELSPLVAVGAVAWLLLLAILIYRWRTYFRPQQSVIPQYEPLPDFKPMFTGVLLDNRLDSRDITAGIIYLAQQGYISIRQTTEKVLFLFDKNDYEITLLKKVYENPESFDDELMSLLFLQPESVGKTLKLSDLGRNRARQQTNYFFVQQIKKAVVKELIDKNFLEQRLTRAVVGFLMSALFFVGYFAITSNFVFDINHFVELVAGFVSALIFLIFASERRTRKGYEAYYYLKGFKQFLSVTEAKRYEFHNAPQKSSQQFMEYLPYAIVFGVEKEWAEIFNDIDVGTPQWYSSSVPGAHFSAAAFTTDLGAFATSFGSSTGSSGFSGSGGGGSAGGGGGGGGGGSW